MKPPSGHRHIGSSFERFLAEQGILGEVDAFSRKRMLARQIEEAMRAQGITRTQLAARMMTTRAVIDRLLDPDDVGVTLAIVKRAALALGGKLRGR